LSVAESVGDELNSLSSLSSSLSLYCCSVCFCSPSVPLSVRLLPYKTRADAAISLYSSGTSTPSVIYSLMTSILNDVIDIIHPSHALRFNLLLPLINVSSALKEYKDKLEYVREVVSLADKVFPPHFLPLCNYRQSLADTIIQYYSSRKNLPKTAMLKLRDERINVLTHLCQSLTIARGHNHQQTIQANQHLQHTINKKDL
jgi:hypothetical protein